MSNSEGLIATVANMRLCAEVYDHVVMIDPISSVYFSATPDDYTMLAEDEPIMSEQDNETPCELGVYVPAHVVPIAAGNFG